MTYNSDYKRGSEWRKWDLHVHTPASVVHGYGSDDDTWEKYISDLENLPTEFIALGINDYLFLDGYERLREEKDKNGRLANIALLLPVVEFRIESFAGVGFGDVKRINFHVIFSDQLTPETIRSQFLNTLEQSYVLEKDGTPWTRAITRESVAELGREIKATVPAAELPKYGSDLQEGFNGLNLKLDQIFKSLEKDCFKDKFLTAVGKTEWADLKWTDASIATKKDIINKAHLVFTAAESPEAFANAKKKLRGQNVNDRLLDCSDAHHYSTESEIKDRIGNCFTWIKADPTFEGLRQVLFEEDERIAVQESLPDDKPGYQVIDRISVKHSDLAGLDLLLNCNLTSIIGGRSTGKSVLLSALARKLNSPRPAKNIAGYNEYIEEIARSLEIKWKDGDENEPREIEFFPQGYMHGLSTNQSQLDKLIQDILKVKGKAALIEAYRRFCEDNEAKIQELVGRSFRIKSALAEALFKLSELADEKGLKDEIAKLTGQIEKLSQSGSLTQAELDSFNEANGKIALLQGEMETLEADLSELEPLADANFVSYDLDLRISAMSENTRLLVEKEFERVRLAFETEWKRTINTLKTTIDTQRNDKLLAVQAIEADGIFKKGKESIETNSMVKELNLKLNGEHKRLHTVRELHQQVNLLDSQSKACAEEIKNTHKAYFQIVEDTAKNLRIEFDGLEIQAKPIFSEERYLGLLNDSINLKSHENQKLVNFSYTTADKYHEHVFDIVERIQRELPLKHSYTREPLIQQLMSSNFYSLSYELVYDGDSFSKMSEGKRAFVVLKLLLDFSDKTCPILIDQPEDDLDNRALYSDLVSYIKKKKKERQIIVVTHNPNIVVGSDSELVIVANQHGVKNENDGGVKFRYVSGALEHTFPKDETMNHLLVSQGIREHVCEVLEGGVDAFKKRENRYSLN
ncbi:MAG: hypothetical protein QM785_17855 [Pyrinomonadaceae bacterium]